MLRWQPRIRFAIAQANSRQIRAVQRPVRAKRGLKTLTWPKNSVSTAASFSHSKDSRPSALTSWNSTLVPLAKFLPMINKSTPPRHEECAKDTRLTSGDPMGWAATGGRFWSLRWVRRMINLKIFTVRRGKTLKNYFMLLGLKWQIDRWLGHEEFLHARLNKTLKRVQSAKKKSFLLQRIGSVLVCSVR